MHPSPPKKTPWYTPWKARIAMVLKGALKRFQHKQVDESVVNPGILLLAALPADHWITARSNGELFSFSDRRTKLLWTLTNWATFGDLRRRLLDTLLSICISFSHEFKNPLDETSLKRVLKKKLDFLSRVLKNTRRINGKLYAQNANNQSPIQGTIQHSIQFVMNILLEKSLIQINLIHNITLATKRQKTTPLLQEVSAALQKGVNPRLSIKGVSGTYFLRGEDFKRKAVFKPYDEEIGAPHCPSGGPSQGALGIRKVRPGLYVGEATHREVAAWLVSKHLDLGVVPHTCYAAFKSPYFYYTSNKLFASSSKLRSKLGSLQSFREDLRPLSDLFMGELARLPVDPCHRLMILDMIIGNTDRHFNNILTNGKEVVGIDHGLCLCDDHHGLTWQLKRLPQSKEQLSSSLVELLKNIPVEKILRVLHNQAFIRDECLTRLIERITLLKAGLKYTKQPFQLADLLASSHLTSIKGRSRSLTQAAEALAEGFFLQYV